MKESAATFFRGYNEVGNKFNENLRQEDINIYKMDKTLCQLCGSENSKYSCPKCNIPYCSVTCYRSEKHLQCSEIFFENWVKEELQDLGTDPEIKKKMLDILKNSQEMIDNNSESSLDSDDEDFEPDLASRMSQVNLDDDEEVWEKLTPEERKEFKKLISTGNIIKILPEWEPWWKTKKRKTLIQDCEEEELDIETFNPKMATDIPKLSVLTKIRPSPHIPFMILNVLASYAFTVRWFKGTYQDMPVEAISTCFALSATLRNNEVFKNPVEAYAAYENDLSKCEWIKQSEIDKNLVHEDLKDIISGSYKADLFFSIKTALSDLNSVTSNAISILQEIKMQHLKRFSGPPPKLKDLQMLSRKITYYLSWTVDNGHLLTNILQGFV